jgi:hypothetical protein
MNQDQMTVKIVYLYLSVEVSLEEALLIRNAVDQSLFYAKWVVQW